MWAALSDWGPLLATAIVALYVYFTIRKSAGEEWRAVAEALEKQVGMLRQEVFDLRLELKMVKGMNETIGDRNLKLQHECERLERRVKQLEGAMVRAGIPVPPEEED